MLCIKLWLSYSVDANNALWIYHCGVHLALMCICDIEFPTKASRFCRGGAAVLQVLQSHHQIHILRGTLCGKHRDKVP